MGAWWPWARRAAAQRRVVLYTRQGCHLCDEAHAVLERARARFGFALALVDVDGDPELARLYGLEVPVVAVDGQVRFRGRVNPVLLHRLLRAKT
jgi:glutaredoxin